MGVNISKEEGLEISQVIRSIMHVQKSDDIEHKVADVDPIYHLPTRHTKFHVTKLTNCPKSVLIKLGELSIA